MNTIGTKAESTTGNVYLACGSIECNKLSKKKKKKKNYKKNYVDQTAAQHNLLANVYQDHWLMLL